MGSVGLIGIVVIALGILVFALRRKANPYVLPPLPKVRAPLSSKTPAAQDGPAPGTYEPGLIGALDAGHARAIPMSVLLLDVDAAGGEYSGSAGRVSEEERRRIWDKTMLSLRMGADTVVRYGPSGLAAVLPDADSELAHSAAERVREAVNQDLGGKRTVSIGVSTWYPAQPYDPAGLAAAADLALFASKRAGGNRCSAMVYPINIGHTMKLSSAVVLDRA